MRRNCRYALKKKTSGKQSCQIYSQFNAGDECGGGGKANASSSDICGKPGKKNAFKVKSLTSKASKWYKKYNSKNQNTTHQEFCFTTKITVYKAGDEEKRLGKVLNNEEFKE